MKVKFGFFILISNYIKDPSEILGDYFDRTKIETAFKTDKEYLRILPLSKWSQRNVEGKIFSDIMTSIFRQRILECVKSRKWSVSSLIGKCQSLMCTFNSEANSVHVDYPSKQVKAFFKEFNIKIPEKIDLLDYLNELYYLKS